MTNDIADVSEALRGRKVLVTGGNGFIGGRLVERLLVECGARPRLILRNYSKAARAARFGLEQIEIVIGELADPDTLDAAVKDCAVVFHCAYDRANLKANATGMEALIQACINNGARLVHVSTISVYEPLPDSDLDESHAVVHSGIPYSETKIGVEEQVLEAEKNRGLDATVVMPTIVYGPYGKAWTLAPVSQMSSGTVLLPEMGNGLCNAVHVDDVCQALIRAAVRPEAKGHRYLISGEEPVTWAAFFKALANAVGKPGPQLLQTAELKRKTANPFSALRLTLGDPKRIFRWAPLKALATWAKPRLTPSMKATIKQIYGHYKKVAPPAIFTPPPQQAALFSAHCRVSIDRAKVDLGYRPAYDFKRGMAATGAWLRWAIPED
jgi:nucleoside-diphosphate-sugar epimerase